MAGLTDRLINRIEVWDKVEFENEMHETDYRFEKIKNIWSEIALSGKEGIVKKIVGDNRSADISHKITIRKNSIQNLENDMYFMYQGQRFDIEYFQPNYRYKDSVEIFCSLVVE